MPAQTAHYDTVYQIFKNLNLTNLSAYILIPKYTNVSTSMYKDFMTTITDVVEQYSILKRKVSLTVFSSSGTYIYELAVFNQDFFSAMVPISSGITMSQVQSYKSYLQTIPLKTYGEENVEYDKNGNHCEFRIGWDPTNAMTRFFTELGRLKDFTNVGKVCHNDIVEYVFNIDDNKDGTSDVLKWMIDQKLPNEPKNIYYQK